MTCQDSPANPRVLTSRDTLLRVRSEHATTPENILVRRTSLAISGTLDLRAIEDIVAVMSDELARNTASRRNALSSAS